MSLLRRALMEALYLADPETAHRLAIRALASGLVPAAQAVTDPRLAMNIAGLDFANPLGMAAGFDKNGEVPDAILRLGFGFTEAGTVTPRPQAGNPRPRIFRLRKSKGVINRLGFNNEGHDAVHARLARRFHRGGIVGVNIGANKDSPDLIADYEEGIRRFAGISSYFTINISSPNTPGLRNLQAGEALERLLGRVFAALDDKESQPPVFLKVAPDLDDADLAAIADVVGSSRLAGLMVSNTTLSRAHVQGEANAREAGGLSGQPLFHRSTVILARFARLLPQHIRLVGIGGIHDAETAWSKIEAGASLLQLYSGMVYEGPHIARQILQGLCERLDAEGLQGLEPVIGRRREDWAGRDPEA